ncbi:MAG TPA: redoxin domain-containing protein [Candidatus Binataceae bacterium]|nr:redoxin domain-containing protein [Candidatus Binataceae bacterium]
MPQINETILAPPLEGGEWIQQGPIDLAQLRGKQAVLLDFWDYTCVNCIRTLPYVVEWHRRYARSGLTVIGVHAPEFSFARDRANVLSAIKQFAIDYPIVLDNAYAIWRAYSNRYWPAKYLIDAEGRLRYYHFGEGLYQETETQIQKLLHEIDPASEFPPPMASIRDTDQPGAVCYRVTPELYLGYARGQFGNPAGVTRDQSFDYPDHGRYVEGMPYLAGRWTVGQESSRADATGAAIVLRYSAMDLNLVMAPPVGGSARIELVMGEDQRAGSDVELAHGRNFVTVDSARMYSLVANETVTSGSLTLKALDAGWSAYAFTFISCPVT